MSNTLSLEIAQKEMPVSASPLMLSPIDKEILKAQSQGKRIALLSANELVGLPTNLLNEAITRTGYKNTFNSYIGIAIEEKKQVILLIAQDLKRFFPMLSMEEALLATQLGANGELKANQDEIIIIAPSQFYKWLKTYKERLKTEACKKKVVAQISAISTDKASEQKAYKLQMMLKILSHFESVKVSKQPIGLGRDTLLATSFYKCLQETGIDIKPALKWQLLEKAIL